MGITDAGVGQSKWPELLTQRVANHMGSDTYLEMQKNQKALMIQSTKIPG